MSTIIAIFGFLSFSFCKFHVPTLQRKDNLNCRFEFLSPPPLLLGTQKVFLYNTLLYAIYCCGDDICSCDEAVEYDEPEEDSTAEDAAPTQPKPQTALEDKVQPKNSTRYPPPYENPFVPQKKASSNRRDAVSHDIPYTKDDISHTENNIPYYTEDDSDSDIPYEAASSSSAPRVQAPIVYTQPQASSSNRVEHQYPPPYETTVAPQHTAPYTQDDDIHYDMDDSQHYPQPQAAPVSFDPWAAHRQYYGHGRRTHGRMADAVVRIPSVYLVPNPDGTVQVIRQ